MKQHWSPASGVLLDGGLLGCLQLGLPAEFIITSLQGVLHNVRRAARSLVQASDPCFHLCRFVVPEEVQPTFVASWREREQDMQQHSGFVDFKLEQDGDKFVVSSR
jgi:hypothetical protein